MIASQTEAKSARIKLDDVFSVIDKKLHWVKLYKVQKSRKNHGNDATEEKNANYKDLGGNVTAKTIYRRLKTTKKQHDLTNFPDLKILNDHF